MSLVFESQPLDLVGVDAEAVLAAHAIEAGFQPRDSGSAEKVVNPGRE
jgi:hypothetical protein